ncbi:aminotransferase class I/II-fold pyridoxal phosphate-dependent enzyme [Aureibacter tunicatorum]|uniref:Glycine C-acetyltransferase n=1 Tax=Aureibacter tunicatorum TaxID=866807 RepID=A0AAE4BUA7_9BACT|nr:aminotransferase class I/II-fold pyridoxal phosphate-dependent enzyme [Aureibacter tunicatorum]MDR6241601.1 glycine C-acetyltransferase [Aureibacter tunicatorum]BDD07175.1 8-amino-7-oxononanoate synthase [Aureibacter tunicatorum]
MDIFNKLDAKNTPLGQYWDVHEGYFMFPKLEGEIGPRMQFQGREILNWSLNSYLGLANHPEIREVDAQATKDWGLASPMGARIMSGNTKYHEKLEKDLAEFTKREDAMLLNFGYQGVFSVIEALVDRNDVIVYDAESHACIIDGVRLHLGKRFVYKHNDIENLETQLKRAEKITKETGGGILIITEGVFGMSGNLGKLKEICALKEKYQFRILLDDAHGFGSMGKTGAGTDEYLDVQDQVDVYISTFAKSMASIGAFVASKEKIIRYLRYSTRSQIFAKSIPMPLVIGNQKRLEMLKNSPQKDKLWAIVNTLQEGLRERGFNIGTTESPVTPVYLNGDMTEVGNMVMDLRENYNLFCSIVTFPMIPRGQVLLRLIPTAAHTMQDVEETIAAFEAIADKLNAGTYKMGGIEEYMPQ